MDVVDERAVEKQKKNPGSGVGQRLQHVALRARLGPRRLRPARRDDVHERLDFLRSAFFEDFEVFGAKAVDDLAVARRIHVHADEAGADPDRLLGLGRQLWLGLRRREPGDDAGEHTNREKTANRAVAHDRTPEGCRGWP